MAFARPEQDEETLRWDSVPSLEREDHLQEASPEAADTEAGSDDSPRRRPAPRATRGAGSASRRPVTPVAPNPPTDEVLEERLPLIKSAAERMRKLKKVAIDPNKNYRRGKRVYDPTVGKFGEVIFTAPGYVRIALQDGTQSTQGKPPLDDRKNFVFANFQRMDNKTMAEILEISVHTMRRLCHEYGLKRHGKKKSA